MNREVFVLTCFQCPFGRVEADDHGRGTIFDCRASKHVNDRPLVVVQRGYTDPPPEQCPLRDPKGVVLRVAS